MKNLLCLLLIITILSACRIGEKSAEVPAVPEGDKQTISNNELLTNPPDTLACSAKPQESMVFFNDHLYVLKEVYAHEAYMDSKEFTCFGTISEIIDRFQFPINNLSSNDPALEGLGIYEFITEKYMDCAFITVDGYDWLYIPYVPLEQETFSVENVDEVIFQATALVTRAGATLGEKTYDKMATIANLPSEFKEIPGVYELPIDNFFLNSTSFRMWYAEDPYRILIMRQDDVPYEMPLSGKTEIFDRSRFHVSPELAWICEQVTFKGNEGNRRITVDLYSETYISEEQWSFIEEISYK